MGNCSSKAPSAQEKGATLCLGFKDVAQQEAFIKEWRTIESLKDKLGYNVFLSLFVNNEEILEFFIEQGVDTKDKLEKYAVRVMKAINDLTYLNDEAAIISSLHAIGREHRVNVKGFKVKWLKEMIPIFMDNMDELYDGDCKKHIAELYKKFFSAIIQHMEAGFLE